MAHPVMPLLLFTKPGFDQHRIRIMGHLVVIELTFHWTREACWPLHHFEAHDSFLVSVYYIYLLMGHTDRGVTMILKYRNNYLLLHVKYSQVKG